MPPPTALAFSMLGGKSKKYKSPLTKIKLRWMDGENTEMAPMMVIPNPTGSLKPVDWNLRKLDWPHLKDLSFPDHPDALEGIHLLIGSNLEEIHFSYGDVRPVEGKGPIAGKGIFGWSAIRRVKTNEPRVGDNEVTTQLEARNIVKSAVLAAEGKLEKKPTQEHRAYFAKSKEDKLVKTMEMQWQLDEMQDCPMPLPKKDVDAIKIINSGVIKNGKMLVPCLWSSGKRPPKANHPEALSRALSLDSGSTFKTSAEKKMYRDKFRVCEKNGIIKKIRKEDEGKGKFYIPHFPIISRGEKETQIRPVMDCASRQGGFSLNNYMAKGPNLMTDLVKVLLRFRKNSVAVIGDISDMFLNIQMAEEDRKYHRFLLVEEDGTITEWEFNAHIFGSAGSVDIACGSTKRLGLRFLEEKPRAAKTIKHSAMIDDDD